MNKLLIVLCILLATIAVAGPSILQVYQGGTGASNGAQALINLIGGSPTSGQALVWNGTGWVPQSVSGTSSGCQVNCNYILTTSDAPSLLSSVNGASSTSQPLLTANRGEFIRFFNNSSRTLGNACADLIVASAGGHADIGVYSIAGTVGTLQWHTGSFSTTTALTALCFTPTPYVMAPGAAFYVAWCADNTTAQLGALNATNGGVTGTIMAAGPANTFGVNSTDVCSSGVLPSSITTSNITNTATQMALPYVSISN